MLIYCWYKQNIKIYLYIYRLYDISLVVVRIKASLKLIYKNKKDKK